MVRLIDSDPIFSRYPLQTILVNQHRTAYIRCGSGPPLVLLHGYAGAIWNWERQIEALSKHFTLYVPDLLGQGLSDKPTITYQPSTYLQWLQGFLDAVSVDRADFVGNSMGCGLAMAIALTHPERVRRLILISGFPGNVLEEAQGPYLKLFLRLGAGFLFAFAYHLMGRRIFRKFLRGIVYNSEQVTTDVIERAYRLRKHHGKAWPLWSSLRHVSVWEQEFAPRVHEIKAPVLIIWGQNDRFFPLTVGQTLHRAIPTSRFAVVPNAGHLPMWEQPDEVNRIILEFLLS